MPIEVEPQPENERYLAAKREKLGHTITKLHHQGVRFEPEPETDERRARDHPDIDDSSENVLSEWPRARRRRRRRATSRSSRRRRRGCRGRRHLPMAAREPTSSASSRAELRARARVRAEELEPEPEELEPEPEPARGTRPSDEDSAAFAVPPSLEHAAGDLEIPEGYAVLEGVADGGRRAVGVVVSRFNGDVTSRLLDRALEELEQAGVRRDAITVMVVPGAFELPVAATALAKTRRFACIVALGCVIRGDTPHFDYVASEAASGLQLAALETGVPVSFGVLTLDRVEQAEPRIEKGAEAVRSALEMADVFSHLARPRRAAGEPGRRIRYTARPHVQGLRHLREEARLRQQPQPLDGRHEAPLQPEPAARPRPPRRTRDARVRLHALPQGRQGPEGVSSHLRPQSDISSRRGARALRRRPVGRSAGSRSRTTAIAQIVGYAAAESYGVVALAGRSRWSRLFPGGSRRASTSRGAPTGS